MRVLYYRMAVLYFRGLFDACQPPRAVPPRGRYLGLNAAYSSASGQDHYVATTLFGGRAEVRFFPFFRFLFSCARA